MNAMLLYATGAGIALAVVIAFAASWIDEHDPFHVWREPHT